MIEKIDEPVTVELISDASSNRVFPSRIFWRQKTYTVKRVGMHHFFPHGKTLIHVFSVTSDTLFFRLTFNTCSLQWKLEEIADNQAN